jgi:hypothetical protein
MFLSSRNSYAENLTQGVVLGIWELWRWTVHEVETSWVRVEAPTNSLVLSCLDPRRRYHPFAKRQAGPCQTTWHLNLGLPSLEYKLLFKVLPVYYILLLQPARSKMVGFLDLTNVLWQCKLVTIGEHGWRLFGNEGKVAYRIVICLNYEYILLTSVI